MCRMSNLSHKDSFTHAVNNNVTRITVIYQNLIVDNEMNLCDFENCSVQ
jgi:hypothetical protein